MKTPYGVWRASYVHGRWTVLSGPTSMVVLEPAPSSVIMRPKVVIVVSSLLELLFW